MLQSTGESMNAKKKIYNFEKSVKINPRASHIRIILTVGIFKTQSSTRSAIWFLKMPIILKRSFEE
jgi:hypothetical protein